MGNRGVFVKICAVAGTVLVWFPILFMLLTSLFGSISSGRFLMDYLIPAELFPFVLGGAVLLLIASLLSKLCRGLICWAIGIMGLSIGGGMLVASLSGLASGATEPAGTVFILVLALIGMYVLCVVVLCIAGILLIKKLFSNKPQKV